MLSPIEPDSPKPDRLAQDELSFRLKGKTEAGKRWNRNYERLVAEYETALGQDSGWATSTAAEIEKVLGGIRRLAEATKGNGVRK